MSVDLYDFFLGTIKSIVFGVIFFLLGLMVVPDRIILWILKKVKTNIFSQRNAFFMNVVNLIVKSEYIERNNSDNKISKLKKIRETRLEIGKIETNIFFVDSLIGLFETLEFIVKRDIANYGLFEDICDYFLHYNSDFGKKCEPEVAKKIAEKFYDFYEKVVEIRDKARLNEKVGFDEKADRLSRIQKLQIVESMSMMGYLKKVQDEYNTRIENLKSQLISDIDCLLEDI